MNVVSIIALTILTSLLQIGCSPVSVSLNSEFGLSLGKTPVEETPAVKRELTIISQPPFLNASNVGGYSVDGTCLNVETIEIKVNGILSFTTTCTNSVWDATLSSAPVPDGEVVIEFLDQDSKASLKTITLQKDVIPPTAVLKNTIMPINNMTDFSIGIIPLLGSVQYSYKYGLIGSTDCANPIGYSNYVAAANDSAETITTLDGTYILCLIGKDEFENEQAYDTATSITWQLDTLAPTVTFATATSLTVINSFSKTAFSIGVVCSEPSKNVKFIATDKNSNEINALVPCSNINEAVHTFNTTLLVDGPVVFTARHSDAAGNVSPLTTLLSVTKDTVAPVLTAGSIDDGSYYSNLNSTPPVSWDSATDTGGSGVAEYQVGFGSTTGLQDVVPFYSVGTNLTAQKSLGTPLTEGTLYYTFVKAVDVAGNFTLQVSNGWKPDVTAPTIASFDDGVYAAAGATPSFSWQAGADGTGSGIDRYMVAVGSSAGAADILSWTSAGTAIAFSTAVSSIAIGGTYYGSVKAIDRAGNSSAVLTGNGFIVKPVMAPGSIVSNLTAFAGIMTNGKVICWGDGSGDYALLPTALKTGPLTAVKLFATSSAFAALMSNGSVITWGASLGGGDSSGVASSLDGTVAVTSITATSSAFAARRTDGSVIVWGSTANGGEIPFDQLTALDGSVPVVSIHSTPNAFAAIRTNGSVVAWGNSTNGGDTSSVSAHIDGSNPVTALYSTTAGAFIAKRSDGSLVTWGYQASGISPSLVASEVSGTIPVVTVTTTGNSVAALRNDGSVITWGSYTTGGDSSSVASLINGTIKVTKIVSNQNAFAAIREDGSVITWGDSTYGGNSSSVASQLTGSPNKVSNIISTWQGGFAALRDNGSLVVWGRSGFGGTLGALSPSEINGANPVTSVHGAPKVFVAIRADNTTVTWGYSTNGGDSGSVASLLNNDPTKYVTNVYSNNFAIAAVLNNGHLVTWGDATYGGDSSHVNP